MRKKTLFIILGLVLCLGMESASAQTAPPDVSEPGKYTRLIRDENNPAGRTLVAKALINKGWRLSDYRKYEEAITTFEEVDRRFGKDDTPTMRELVAMALIGKSATLGRIEQFDNAIATYEELNRRFGKDASPNIRILAARALFNKGEILNELEQFKKAIAAYEEVGRHFGKDDSQYIQEVVDNALKKAKHLRRNQASKAKVKTQ